MMCLLLLLLPLQKAEKSALESKVSNLQFDSEQLSVMLKELLNKVTGQEQDWHRVVDRLSTEMDCKVGQVRFRREGLDCDRVMVDLWRLCSSTGLSWTR